ncbi:hypothetical protein ON010_g10288 [Phytophthora cinnamomi]|nr:hypothetical protein ON010_g10288 [Phytophthora cinnamomi]
MNWNQNEIRSTGSGIQFGRPGGPLDSQKNKEQSSPKANKGRVRLRSACNRPGVRDRSWASGTAPTPVDPIGKAGVVGEPRTERKCNAELSATQCTVTTLTRGNWKSPGGPGAAAPGRFEKNITYTPKEATIQVAELKKTPSELYECQIPQVAARLREVPELVESPAT